MVPDYRLREDFHVDAPSYLQTLGNHFLESAADSELWLCSSPTQTRRVGADRRAEPRFGSDARSCAGNAVRGRLPRLRPPGPGPSVRPAPLGYSTRSGPRLPAHARDLRSTSFTLDTSDFFSASGWDVWGLGSHSVSFAVTPAEINLLAKAPRSSSRECCDKRLACLSTKMIRELPPSPNSLLVNNCCL
ncbi:lactosylceramide 1,3-N-acetyl-beta-D-glucosaminyltransferase isoform X2 [Nannospalax galili]|uniref:lactosylceramide 1,3-N-acetyl-beta-D-glucosaminyltransferase isoform X2 n=1 Tax=Nannospalax galili TaxID=1026970 RepID=UPI00111C1CCC|nr:lactosylceramide 1,3-N-acetyl-beta-D-glucosaminyltransferase isoform X2 [Nannospalax galili]